MTILEKASRAIHAHWMDNYPHGPFVPDRRPYDELDDSAKAYALGQARAVIEAIREADLETRQAGKRIWLNGMDSPSVDISVSSGRNFTAMIDHILSDGEGK